VVLKQSDNGQLLQLHDWYR